MPCVLEPAVIFVWPVICVQPVTASHNLPLWGFFIWMYYSGCATQVFPPPGLELASSCHSTTCLFHGKGLLWPYQCLRWVTLLFKSLWKILILKNFPKKLVLWFHCAFKQLHLLWFVYNPSLKPYLGSQFLKNSLGGQNAYEKNILPCTGALQKSP